ncbi:MAG: PIG-L family deacetylase [Alphaproteobacteria bacterium]
MFPFASATVVDAASDSGRRRLADALGRVVLVAAPHCDDAPYSLAGTMRALAAAGCGVTMLTIFGRSAYAPNRPGLDIDAVSALRQAEDVAAAGAIATGIAVRALAHEDVAVRRALPVERVVSKAALDDDDRGWIDRVAAELAAAAASHDAILAPLGMGWHLDHRIVAAAGARLARQGAAVTFYEDLPYAGFTRDSRLWLAQLRRLRAVGLCLRPLDVRCADLPALKRAVFDAYPSQASDAFWRGIARQTERRQGAERLWLRRGAGSA